jgi:hypothetical protein
MKRLRRLLEWLGPTIAALLTGYSVFVFWVMYKTESWFETYDPLTD